jgi:hypothetical protein
MSFLTELLTRLAEVPADEQPNVIAEAIAQAGNLDADALSDAVMEAFDELTGDGSVPPSDENLQRLETLARVADGVQSVRAQAADRAARAAEIGDRLRSLAPAAQGGDGEGEGGGGAEGEGDTGGDQAPADAATEGDGDGEGGGGGEGAEQGAGNRELVAAGLRRPAAQRVPLGGRRGQVPTGQNQGGSGGQGGDQVVMYRETFSLVAAADVPGFGTGQTLGGGLGDLAAAWESRMIPLVTSNVNSGVDGQRTRVGLARLRREVPDQFVIRDDHEAQEKIEFATNERNLPGGSLVAAAGWCAPSETLYDLCDIRITDQGMINLPSIVATRGGIRYPADFDWAAVWSSIGFYLTEAEVIAGTEKPCVEVPCEDDFQECRMDVSGLCIRTPILMERGWPERVRQFMQGAMLIHGHKMNAKMIAKMEALSTAITMPGPANPNPNAAIVDPHGPGAFESVLSMLELQIQFQRYRDRLSQTESLELLAPFWLRGILKSDLRKKLGIDNRYDVTDADLDRYFRAIGANPQWVYDWQDSFSEPLDPNAFGGPVPTVWPASVKVLLYRAGTFFKLGADVINLDGVYDHASLVQNTYTALFTEEGWQVCQRCGDSFVITIPLCANGLSGGQQLVQCAA